MDFSAHDTAFTSDDFVEFFHARQPHVQLTRSAVEDAIKRSIIVTARSRSRLCGFARILTDGYSFGTIAEVRAHPELWNDLAFFKSLLTTSAAACPTLLTLATYSVPDAMMTEIGWRRQLPSLIFKRKARVATSDTLLRSTDRFSLQSSVNGIAFSCNDEILTPLEFVHLLRESTEGTQLELGVARDMLSSSINLTARRGNDLIGVVRVISDGLVCGAVAQVVRAQHVLRDRELLLHLLFHAAQMCPTRLVYPIHRLSPLTVRGIGWEIGFPTYVFHK